jgi:pimeloyl-[acyl-carrier protein] methyl ester esterase
MIADRSAGRGQPGSAEPESAMRDVVLLHGWGSTAAVWNDLRSRLSARIRIGAPELPGHGSSLLSVSDTLDLMADALARSAPKRCDVVGWSLGGLVALAWAAAAPEQVGRLALIATTPSFVQRPGWPDAMAEETFAGFEAALGADPASALHRFVLLQAQDDRRAKSVARQLRGAMAMPAPALGAGLSALRSADLRPRLSSVRAPVLVLHGERDRLVPAAAGERLSRLLPTARFHAMPGAAHAPFLSDPAAVAAALQEHFDV